MSNVNKFDILSTTPVIPASVYDSLPAFLKEVTDKFDDPREKDVVLTSALTILSGCFYKIEGVYGKDWVSPSLYTFIVAPPASGKSVMKYPRFLGKSIQELLIKMNEEAKNKYETEKANWKRALKKGEETAGNVPKKPKYPVLFIPGNTSSTAIYKRLLESGGMGIICETEADTLSGAISQDWGNFSDLLRKGFQHEPLSLVRSGEDILMYIERPQLSVLLTGTPDQVPRLIRSAQDGLCSRFLFYCYSRPLQWIDPTPCNDCPDLGGHFEKLGETVASIEKQLSGGDYSFKLTNEQFSRLSDNFRKKITAITPFEGAEAASAVVRLGVIGFRIAMILTVLRRMDIIKEGQNLECSEEDFKASMALVDVYFEHAMVMYSLLPKSSKGTMSPKIRQFYTLLPHGEKFPRKKGDDIGKSIGISERSVGNYLDELVEKGFLTKPEYGTYQKPEDDEEI